MILVLGLLLVLEPLVLVLVLQPLADVFCFFLGGGDSPPKSSFSLDARLYD